MIIVGALALVYAFCYCTGSLAELGQSVINLGGGRQSVIFTPADGKNGVDLYTDIQPFNTFLMWVGIISILLGVLLYITACNSRRNYYISNYVATGVCAGGNIILALVALILNGYWRGQFLNIDFEAWAEGWAKRPNLEPHYSESTLGFDLGFVVYIIMIIASIILILNLVWKIKLMQGEKKLLAGTALEGGVA